MPRLICLDYGAKRTGIAVTDELQIIATGLCTVDTSALMVFLQKYFLQEKVEGIVIGMPRRLNNTDTHATGLVLQCIKQLQEKFPTVPVHTLDERFTSKMATQAILASGIKKKERQNKALVDEVSATIILQDFLMSKK